MMAACRCAFGHHDPGARKTSDVRAGVKMEKLMDDLTRNATGSTPRRGFFRRIAGAMALGLAGVAPDSSYAQGAAARPGGPNWPGPLKGRHRQLVDAYEINKGAPLAFAHTFLATSEPATSEPPPANIVAATAVVVLRHNAFPLALVDKMWHKYKIGESFKIDDPETKAPAFKNPFLHPKAGVLPEGMAIDLLLASGTVFGACHVALLIQSNMLAGNAGVSAQAAADEWSANVIPGITILPSGVWGVNRAQEAGCTYCAGG
jgi:hypothetical protein